MAIKKDDTVYVIAGKEKNKKGKILSINQQKQRALVQGVNFSFRHTRAKRQGEPGGILQKESPLHISNLMFFCPRCSKPARLGMKFLNDGTKVRFCKNCQEVV
ncbi:MAG: 50S ribosomal protein L24 [Candidatus Omnitrophota bacterium]|nr:MAG: 50S ribosomal protein L24 [Candidatus Omnitrophota bacterium]